MLQRNGEEHLNSTQKIIAFCFRNKSRCQIPQLYLVMTVPRVKVASKATGQLKDPVQPAMRRRRYSFKFYKLSSTVGILMQDEVQFSVAVKL